MLSCPCHARSITLLCPVCITVTAHPYFSPVISISPLCLISNLAMSSPYPCHVPFNRPLPFHVPSVSMFHPIHHPVISHPYLSFPGHNHVTFHLYLSCPILTPSGPIHLPVLFHPFLCHDLSISLTPHPYSCHIHFHIFSHNVPSIPL